MINKNKTVEYVNAVCKSNEQKLLGAERLRRMAESSSLEECFAILRENTFFGGEGEYLASDFAKLLQNEELRLINFIKEYAPNRECELFCLSHYDFYNAEVLVKCEFNKIPCDKFIGAEGIYSVEQLKNQLLQGKGDFCKELVGAVNDSRKALSEGFGGMSVGTIFKKAYFKALLKNVKTAYIKEIIKDRIDALNVLSCLRSENFDMAKGFFIEGGNLSKQCYKAISERNESAVKALIPPHLREITLRAMAVADRGEALIEFERNADSLGAQRMIDNRYFELDGTNPFILYYYRRKNEIQCARTVLTGKQNSLDAELIKLRMITV